MALSRARLGLYVFGRREVFESCIELQQAFERLFRRPDKLHVVVGELFGIVSRNVEEEVESTEMVGVEHLGQYVFEMTKAKVASLKEGRETLPVAEVNGGGAEEDEDVPGENVMDDVDEDERADDVILGDEEQAQEPQEV